MPDRPPFNVAELLPFNATTLEIDLLSLAPDDMELHVDIRKLQGVRSINIPESYLNWLLLEYGGAWIQEYIPDARAALAQAIYVRRFKGTIHGLKTGAGWLNLTATSIIERDRPCLHFAEYGIETGEVIRSLPRIASLHNITSKLQPARSRLRRLVHGYDVRMLFLNEGRLNQNMLSSDSGVPFDAMGFAYRPTGMMVSFQQRYRDETSALLEYPDDLHVSINEHFDFAGDGNVWPDLNVDFMPAGGSYAGFNPCSHVPREAGETFFTDKLQLVANWDIFCWNDTQWDYRECDDLHTSPAFTDIELPEGIFEIGDDDSFETHDDGSIETLET